MDNEKMNAVIADIEEARAKSIEVDAKALCSKHGITSTEFDELLEITHLVDLDGEGGVMGKLHAALETGFDYVEPND
jgi:hypothetical protein